MPKYFISTSEETLKGISAIKATQMGCSGVTSFWWGVIAHPSNGEYALVIPDEECVLASAVYDEEGELVTPAETVKTLYVNPPENPTVTITTEDLVDHATLEAGGWFPIEEGV
jgi:hypothetical protein